MVSIDFRRLVPALVMLAALFATALPAWAIPPQVKVAPFDPNNLLTPHDTYSGKQITLKGTSNMAGPTIEYRWEFGDGSADQVGAVILSGSPSGTQRRQYAIDATHIYTGAVDTFITARLTVRNTSVPADTTTVEYYIHIREKTLPVEVNIAVDEGLWYLHKTMNRSVVDGAEVGDWRLCPFGTCYATTSAYAATPANLQAFLVNGHRENGNPNNPYTETVARAMRRTFQFLATTTIPATQTNPRGTFNPDTNANGYGAYVNDSYELYQGGFFIDAIVAAGTPNAITTTGTTPSGSNPGIRGRTYRSVVQDMVDYYAYCQYDGSSGSLALGGWRYSCNSFPDNSAVQWAAIGLLPAERDLGIPIPPPVEAANEDWTTYSQNATTGVFGYTDPSPVWGPLGTTPSGMVQLAWTGIGRGNPKWDRSERFMRDVFGNPAGATSNPKDYYYGLFSFTKAMLLHDSNDDHIAEPITLLQSTTAGVNPIDWYAAERNPLQAESVNNTDGVARTLVNDQNAVGYWRAHNYDSSQYPFETAWAVIMLRRTILEATPIAVADATPNPGIVGQTINFSGGSSYHLDPAKTIVAWDWDLDNNGTFETSGVLASRTFPTNGEHTVVLRVSDNSVPPKTDTVTVKINIVDPPIPPTADAGGPYNFCTNKKPWFLNGTGSSNPDEGASETGQPANTIIEYSWDLPPGGSFGDATGKQPDVTPYFTGLGAAKRVVFYDTLLAKLSPTEVEAVLA
ncbi:MAG TPA: hypothetical protein DEH78_22950, partial [Solibacterales bacterium]|nr:hypothetical protein [Bryobacterales bacterium]